MPTPRQRIRELFGFDFPDDFFEFHDFLEAHPSASILSSLEMSPTALFSAFTHPFAGFSLAEIVKKSRYYNDPPEWLTLFDGNTDGLHWGYFFDDPGNMPPVVASYYHSDGYEFSVKGNTLFQCCRQVLEQRYETCRSDITYDPDHADSYRAEMENLDSIRDLLGPHTASRSEKGFRYCIKYDAIDNDRRSKTVVSTFNGMGVVAEAAYAFPPGMGYDTQDIFDIKDLGHAADLATAYQLQAADYPAAALRLGQDLWVHPGFRTEAHRLLQAAYSQLKRPILGVFLEIARSFREECDAENAR